MIHTNVFKVLKESIPQQVLNINGVQVAPKDTSVLTPSFDVTPYRYFAAIVTEKGVAYPLFSKSLRELAEK